ncbi:MAG: NAD(P)/FAD-dependent oxidoreductase [Aggregatilineales bacterium]
MAHLTDTLPATADVVIIGAGLAGTAAAWALTRFQPDLQVVLLEKNAMPGAGSSSASLECFRSCWYTPCIARMMERSLEVFLNSDEIFGDGAASQLAVRQNGYLFCAFTEKQAQDIRDEVAHLHSIGLNHVEYLEADALYSRFSLPGDNVLAAKFDPMAGWLDSNALLQLYLKNSSVTLVTDVQQTRITTDAGRITGVTTSKGDIVAPKVLIAAGAGSYAIGRNAGVELPIVMRPRQSFTTGWRHDAISQQSPMIIGSAPFPHFRPEARSGAIFGWEYEWTTKGLDDDNRLPDALREPASNSNSLKDPRFPSITLALLARQFGHGDDEGFNDGRYLRNLHHNIGYYVYRDEAAAYTIDDDGNHVPYESQRAIIDKHPDIEGLYLSIAHVGHGIMTSPAAGEIAAQHILQQSLSDPIYADFGLDVTWVEHDESVL